MKIGFPKFVGGTRLPLVVLWRTDCAIVRVFADLRIPFSTRRRCGSWSSSARRPHHFPRTSTSRSLVRVPRRAAHSRQLSDRCQSRRALQPRRCNLFPHLGRKAATGSMSMRAHDHFQSWKVGDGRKQDTAHERNTQKRKN